MTKTKNNLDIERLKSHYRQMLRIRLFESEAVHAIADGLVPGFIHPSIGQEAVPVGVCAHLAKDDLLLSTHRGHGHTLAKGADPEAMMRELFGREGGTCRGKGGSMHIADFSIGMLGANGVVATNITIAAGAAHALKLRGKNAVVACFFGDGATNRGPFLEGLNWAKAFDLPVLFICEDNQWSATTKTSTVLSGPGPLARAQSLGLAGTSINGNDILAVDEAAGAAICAIKSGSGPYFLHCCTYRHGGHTGTDPAAYRDPDEAAKGIEGDPLPACAELLRNANVDESNIIAIEKEVAAEMRRIRENAARAPWPDRSITYEDVQDLGAAGART